MAETPTQTRRISYYVAQLNELPNVYAYRSSTGGARTATRMLKFGVKGQADVTAIVQGRAVYIEDKSEHDVQSPEQKQFQARVEAAGGIYILARSLDDVMDPVVAMIEAE